MGAMMSRGGISSHALRLFIPMRLLPAVVVVVVVTVQAVEAVLQYVVTGG
jgi:hypothetical protein